MVTSSRLAPTSVSSPSAKDTMARSASSSALPTPTNKNQNKITLKPNEKPPIVKYMFRLAADTVGKREFLLRTKQFDVMRHWVEAIKALNMQRVKLIVLDLTRELTERIGEQGIL